MQRSATCTVPAWTLFASLDARLDFSCQLDAGLDFSCQLDAGLDFSCQLDASLGYCASLERRVLYLDFTHLHSKSLPRCLLTSGGVAPPDVLYKRRAVTVPKHSGITVYVDRLYAN
jgi:hypothetical protein